MNNTSICECVWRQQAPLMPLAADKMGPRNFCDFPHSIAKLAFKIRWRWNNNHYRPKYRWKDDAVAIVKRRVYKRQAIQLYYKYTDILLYKAMRKRNFSLSKFMLITSCKSSFFFACISSALFPIFARLACAKQWILTMDAYEYEENGIESFFPFAYFAMAGRTIYSGCGILSSSELMWWWTADWFTSQTILSVAFGSQRQTSSLRQLGSFAIRWGVKCRPNGLLQVCWRLWSSIFSSTGERIHRAQSEKLRMSGTVVQSLCPA